MSYWQMPLNREGLKDPYVYHAMGQRYHKTHGPRPISYVFHNGHPSFGEQMNGEELPGTRSFRIARNWAPWEGAIEGCVPRDEENVFNFIIPYLVVKVYVGLLDRICTRLLPLIRKDGEGSVVLQTPEAGSLGAVKSVETRLELINPSPNIFWDHLKGLRLDIETIMKKKQLPLNSPWPGKREFLGLADVFARSAITTFKSQPEYKTVALNRIPHDPMKLDDAVDLLFRKDRLTIQPTQFSRKEIADASRVYPTDIQGLINNSFNVADTALLWRPDAKGSNNSWNVRRREGRDPNVLSFNNPLVRPAYPNSPMLSGDSRERRRQEGTYMGAKTSTLIRKVKLSPRGDE
ncbi:hypothetical protein ABW19_dt0207836 [Dactylella cylindrospora]|nr:hypothetical protein ABW19_dt0207836 [Dactylella cylindrospora]